MASPMHTCTNALQGRRLAKFVELEGNMDKKEEQMELCRAEGKNVKSQEKGQVKHTASYLEIKKVGINEYEIIKKILKRLHNGIEKERPQELCKVAGKYGQMQEKSILYQRLIQSVRKIW